MSFINIGAHTLSLPTAFLSVLATFAKDTSRSFPDAIITLGAFNTKFIDFLLKQPSMKQSNDN